MARYTPPDEYDKIDPYNFEINYQEYFPYDFDVEDRPCVYPNDSYSKYCFPENQSFRSMYSSEQSAGGQPLDKDWESVVCSNFLG